MLPTYYVKQGLCNGRASVRLSVPSTDSSSESRRVCCRAPCGHEISTDSCGRRCRALAAGALSSKWGQCHVDSRGRGCTQTCFELRKGWLGSRVVSVLDSDAEGSRFKSQSRRCRVSLRQTVHTYCASVHQAATLVAALLSNCRPGGK